MTRRKQQVIGVLLSFMLVGTPIVAAACGLVCDHAQQAGDHHADHEQDTAALAAHHTANEDASNRPGDGAAASAQAQRNCCDNLARVTGPAPMRVTGLPSVPQQSTEIFITAHPQPRLISAARVQHNSPPGSAARASLAVALRI